MHLSDLVAAAPRLDLAHLPTPIEPMPRLTRHLSGPRLWVKRDDLTGLGLGGNKVRKLEYVLPDALDAGADTLVTAGVAQSNSVRQVAAAASRAGLGCHVIEFTDRPGAATPPGPPVGNALLARLFGAHVEPGAWTGDRNVAMEDAADRLRTVGKRPFIVPYGVSSPVGALGYVAAAHEIQSQAAALGVRFRAVVHASGSGGTQAGLIAGFHGGASRVFGIDVDAEPERVAHDVTRIAGSIDPEGRDALAAEVDVVGGFAGATYGAVTDAALTAIDLAARLEGLVLDVVYSGKGLAGLIGLVESGMFRREDDVLFVHTGGASGLLAMPGVVAGIHRGRIQRRGSGNEANKPARRRTIRS